MQRGPARSMQNRLQNFLYNNPLYHLTLQRAAPKFIHIPPQDMLPASAAVGADIINGIYSFAGQTITSANPIWLHNECSDGWHAGLHGFAWLRHLRVSGGDAARRQARRLVAEWLDQFSTYHPLAWRADIMGTRLASWLLTHDFFLASADDAFRARVYGAIAVQAAHLSRTVPGLLEGADLLNALRGLTLAGLALPDGDDYIAHAFKHYATELPRQIVSDGGHITRAPSVMMDVLRGLIDVRNALRHERIDVPDDISHAIERLTPALKFFKHSDGGLALFNGSFVRDALTLDALFNLADSKARPLKSLPQTGFERLALGRTSLIVDTGVPPARGVDRAAHAGTLSFELCVGKERVIVNCGAHAKGSKWFDALRGTAAHSTLMVNDRDSSIITASGLGARPFQASATRNDSKDFVELDCFHDGYLDENGLMHRRIIRVEEQGDVIKGYDILTQKQKIRVNAKNADPFFTVRFHLHPDIQATATQNKQSVILKLASNAGWRFRCPHHQVVMDESVWFGDGFIARRNQQMVITGGLTGDETVIEWTLSREKKN